MAITDEATTTVSVRQLGIVRLALTGALAAAVFYALCWVGALIPVLRSTSHMYLQLFTNAELTSGTALVQGELWSLIFGFIAGALVAVIYNALAFLDRK